MAKCAICEKAAHFGNAVSHSHRRSNKMWKANVKSVKVKVNGGAKKMYVCTSCLRSGLVERRKKTPGCCQPGVFDIIGGETAGCQGSSALYFNRKRAPGHVSPVSNNRSLPAE